MSEMRPDDFEAATHGGFRLLQPVSIEAIHWVTRNIPVDAPMLADRIAIELRDAPAIIDEIENEGLTIA